LLVPSTDNRPNGNAYAPGDIVFMHSGQTVEVLNTDAEGRLLLADALSYAKEYQPELVIDVATLTGSAARAIGLDIAGPAFLNAPDHYRTKGGTATGVRLLIDFLKSLV
jgi:leucyl aminopeptidase